MEKKNSKYQFFCILQFSLILIKAVGISNLSWIQTLIPTMFYCAITIFIVVFAAYITYKEHKKQLKK